LSTGTLGTSDLTYIADAALAYQADSNKPWDTAWGDWLEKCETANKLSDARWKQYVEHAGQAAFILKLRPRVRRGDPLPYVIATNQPRAGTSGSLMTEVKGLELEWISPHGPVTVRGGIGAMGCGLIGVSGGSVSSSSTGSALEFDDFPKVMPDVPQQMRYRGTVNIGYTNCYRNGQVLRWK
jgi:hypothetical protein